ncbi:unnamed protein product [Symbiodinium sp. CCMP2456]|nr:unnamed protein product [Symbiodinium sp. CCMP2456]
MGIISSCCSHDASVEAEENKSTMKKEPSPTKADATEMAVAPAASREKERMMEKSANVTASGSEYEITLDKSTGKRLGIDVDHKDGKTLLIECINEGLVKAVSAAALLPGSFEWSRHALPSKLSRLPGRLAVVLAQSPEKDFLRSLRRGHGQVFTIAMDEAFAHCPASRLAAFDAGARMVTSSVAAVKEALAKVSAVFSSSGPFACTACGLSPLSENALHLHMHFHHAVDSVSEALGIQAARTKTRLPPSRNTADEGSVPNLCRAAVEFGRSPSQQPWSAGRAGAAKGSLCDIRMVRLPSTRRSVSVPRRESQGCRAA